MKFFVSPDLLELFPDLRIAVLVGQGLDNRQNMVSAHQALIGEIQRIRAKLTLESLDILPEITAWREAYTLLALKPKRNRPSAENLLRYVIRSGEMDPISPIVDVYLATQLRFLLPIGGYDCDRLEGDVTLRRSPGKEPFHEIGKPPEDPPDLTEPGETVYADSSKILTRRWNWRDGELTKITPESQNIVLMAEAPSAIISTATLQNLLKYLEIQLEKCCGGNISSQIWVPSLQPELAIGLGRS